MINLELTEQQELLRKTCEDFASRDIRPAIRDIEKKGTLLLSEKIRELGLFGFEFPEELGGAGLGMTERVLVLKTMSEKGDGGTVFSIFYPLFPIYALFELTELKDIVKDALAGKRNIALAKCGLAPSYINTRARLREKEIRAVIEEKNVKEVVFFAEESEGKYCLCISDDFETEKEIFRSGLKSSPAIEVKLTRFEKISTNVTKHENWDKFLGRMKLAISSICVGICRASTNYALDYALERVAFGKPIAYHQALSFMLADMDTLTDSIELLLFKSAYDFDSGKKISSDSTTELFLETLDIGRKIVSDAVQILGGHGYIKDHPVEKWMRDFEDVINAFGSPLLYEGSIKDLCAELP